jgi:hypothetical protein
LTGSVLASAAVLRTDVALLLPAIARRASEIL